MRRMWIVAVGVVSALLPAQQLERAVAAAEALGARTGVAVCDAEGRVLYRHRAAEAFAPASNMKVLTAAAVLQGLGADYQFSTRFLLRGGRLVVLASGDPNWITGSAHSPELVFGEVAASLQRLGVTALRGIDLDPGTFTGPTRPATWPQDQLHARYCAPTGPFLLDQGTFALAIDAAGRPQHANVRLVAPLAALPLRGAIELVDRAKGATYGAIDLGDAVQVRGRFHRKSVPVQIYTAVREPSAWYEATLRAVLAASGIPVDPGAEVVQGAAALGDVVVHDHRSDLRAAMLRMLEDSSNVDAEQCLRVLGHATAGDGSLAGGLAAMHRQLQKSLGEIPAGVVLADGSGLSKENRITPGLLVVALFASQRGPGGAVLRESLPVAGRSGTLEDRFVGSELVGRVRAKTGWIRGASSLSGLVEGKDGSVRWFSILMNYDPKKNGLNKDLKLAQEAIVRAIDQLPASR